MLDKIVGLFKDRFTFILTISPFIGYLFAYFFESSYLSYFDLPNYLVSISIENIIIAISSLFGAIVTLIIIIYFIYPLIHAINYNDPIGHNIFWLLIYSIGILFIVVITPPGEFIDKVITAFLYIATVAIVDFGWPLLFHRRVPYKEKVRLIHEAEINSPQLFDVFIKTNTMFYLLIGFIIAIGVFASQSLGEKFARDQRYFITYSKDNNLFVLIRSYSSYNILLGINKNIRKFNNNILLIPKRESIEGKIESVGPLISYNNSKIIKGSFFRNLFVNEFNNIKSVIYENYKYLEWTIKTTINLLNIKRQK